MTLIGHAVAGAAFYTAVRPWGHQTMFGLPKHWAVWLAMALALAPDLDALGALWGSATDSFNPQGVLHSWVVALFASALLVFALQATGRMMGGRRTFLLGMAFVFGLLSMHSCTDALTDDDRGVMLFWPLSTERVTAPFRPLPSTPAVRDMVRTEWSAKQRRRMERVRSPIVDDDRVLHAGKRWAVSLVDDPTHAPRLALLGVGLTEVVLLLPLFFIGWWRRRKQPPPPPPIEYKRLATITAWVIPRPSRTIGAVVASVSGVLFVTALVFSRTPNFGLKHSRMLLGDGDNTPAYVVRPKAETVPEPYALLVHDWRGSHETLLPLARMLARNGLEVVNVDVAGHSGNKTPFDLSCRTAKKRPCRGAAAPRFAAHVKDMLLALQDTRRFYQRPVILVGHGAGATAALRAQHPAVVARVALAGTVDEKRLPHNVIWFPADGQERRLSSRVKRNRRVGKTARGEAYAVYLNKLSSQELTVDAAVNQKILSWIKLTTGAKLIPVRDEENPSPLARRNLLAAFFGLAFALGCLHFLLALLTDALPKLLDRRSNLARPGLALFFMVFGTLATALHFGALAEDGEVWLLAQTGVLVPPALGAFALWGAIPYLAALLHKTRGGDREGRAVLVPRPTPLLATVLAVGLYALLFTGVADGAFYHGAVPLHRLNRWLLYSALLFPFARVVQDVGPQALRFWPRAGRMTLRCGLWAGACVLLAMGRSTLDTTTMAIAAMAVVGEAFGAVVLRHTGSRFAAALTVALVFGGAFAAVFPMVVSTTT